MPPDGLVWVHDAFTLDTVPITHSLCGDFTYLATFDSNYIDTLSSPMVYDTTSRTYSIYSEEFGLIGSHTFTLEGFLTDYPVTATATQALTSTIVIVDPCIDPDLLEATTQAPIDDYYYTVSPIIDFVLNPFNVFPPTCTVTYSCDNGVTGPVNFDCDWTQNGNYGTFDPLTGNYQML